jgi:hypothetical protein
LKAATTFWVLNVIILIVVMLNVIVLSVVTVVHPNNILFVQDGMSINNKNYDAYEGGGRKLTGDKLKVL